MNRFEDPNNEQDNRRPEEKALDKATTKTLLTKEEEFSSLRNVPEQEELDILLDKEDTQKTELSLANQEMKNIEGASFLSGVGERLKRLEEDFLKTINTYGSREYKIDLLRNLIKDKFNELNEIHEMLLGMLTQAPPAEPRQRKLFFEQQKEMVKTVKESRRKIGYEIQLAINRIKELKASKVMTEEEAKEAAEELQKLQIVLKPGTSFKDN